MFCIFGCAFTSMVYVVNIDVNIDIRKGIHDQRGFKAYAVVPVIIVHVDFVKDIRQS